MNYQNPSFQPMGERAVLVIWEPVIEEGLLRFILFAKDYFQNSIDKPIVEVINTYNSLLIRYKYGIKNIYDEILTLKQQLSTLIPPKKMSSQLYYLPVCYDQQFGLDLEEISGDNKRISEIIRLHSDPVYTIYFMGFLPGFLYLGGLKKSLFYPRKNHPRKRVEKGAVGIGGNQTGIYPRSSPGGWQIIGNCPIDFFDVDQNPPSVFRAGDKIKFHAISVEEHAEILERVKTKKYSLKTETV